MLFIHAKIFIFSAALFGVVLVMIALLIFSVYIKKLSATYNPIISQSMLTHLYPEEFGGIG